MNKIKVEIGSKAMSELTPENMLHIVSIEGCSPSHEYWNKPDLLDFDNKMFSNVIVVEYVCYRKKDNKRSAEFTFFFQFKEFYFHYSRDDHHKQPNHKRVGLSTLRYLIEQGFNVPIY